MLLINTGVPSKEPLPMNLLATGKELQTEITDGIRIYGNYDALKKVM
jgi:hypothetical protein